MNGDNQLVHNNPANGEDLKINVVVQSKGEDRKAALTQSPAIICIGRQMLIVVGEDKNTPHAKHPTCSKQDCCQACGPLQEQCQSSCHHPRKAKFGSDVIGRAFMPVDCALLEIDAIGPTMTVCPTCTLLKDTCLLSCW